MVVYPIAGPASEAGRPGRLAVVVIFQAKETRPAEQPGGEGGGGRAADIPPLWSGTVWWLRQGGAGMADEAKGCVSGAWMPGVATAAGLE